MEQWTLYFDGLCEPRNPGGRMAWGWNIIRPGMPDVGGCGTEAPKVENTNNVAEFCAMGFGLREIQTLLNIVGVKPDKLIVRGDSQLAVKIVNGEWKCHKPHLAILRDRCQALLKEIGVPYEVEWVPREENEIADQWSRKGYADAEGKMPPERRKAS